MKKTLLVLSSFLILGLAACNRKPVNPTPGQTTPVVTPTSTPTPSEVVTPSEVEVTYTVTDLPDWITNDGCVIFAWVWGGSAGNGKWVSLEFTSPTSASFKLSDDITGFLLARCVSGTTEPNWQTKGNEVGRIYNQTDDITVSLGVTTYSCSSWKEYNPS